MEKKISTDSRFGGRNALVTGGTSGIGHATSARFAREGARVWITGRRSAAPDLPAGVSYHQSDAGDPRAAEQLVRDVLQDSGGIDILVLNAAIARFGELELLDETTFEAVWRTNTLGPWYLLKHSGELMPRGGAIVIVTSIANQLGTPGSSAYAASKAALRAIARTAAIELGRQNIRVNCVSPGPVDTPIYDKLGIAAEAAASFRASIVNQVPIGRMGTPEEIAGTIAFLASADSGFIVGAELVVDGGLTLL
jgi:NAD(P)-dependent dehydrogenase (short-subunit alcohol dehydrogenase family)